MSKHGHFYWNELMTRDVEKAKAFFGETVGWTFDGMPMDGTTYWVAMQDGEAVGGMFTMEGPHFEGVPEAWMAYLAVDDIDARVSRARSAGAEILREPWDVPGVGRIALVKDPTGAVLGWMTPSDSAQAG